MAAARVHGRFEGRTSPCCSYEASRYDGEIARPRSMASETRVSAHDPPRRVIYPPIHGKVAEAIGLTIPNVSMCPASSRASAISLRRGGLVMEMLQRGVPLPREIVTRKALENGAAIVRCTAASTQCRSAVFRRLPMKPDILPIADVGHGFRADPLSAPASGRKYNSKDVYDIGGTAVIIRAPFKKKESGHIDGRPDHHRPHVRKNRGCECARWRISIYNVVLAIMPDGGVAVRRVISAPTGAVHSVLPASSSWCLKVAPACSRTRKDASRACSAAQK